MFEKLPATPDDFYQDIIGETLTANQGQYLL